MTHEAISIPPPLGDDWSAGLAAAPARVLMLDYDGTLAPFREERDLAVPYPGVRERLAGLMASGHTRLVIVSGRAVSDLQPLLNLDPTPEIWGSHGWERRGVDGSQHTWLPGEPAAKALADADSIAQRIGLETRCEVKTASIAVHWRGLSDGEAEALRASVAAEWRPLTEGGSMELHEFDGGLELRVAGRDKGTVADSVLAEVPAGAFAAYLGDDRTDEDAFRALAGRGLTLLVRAEPRPSCASAWIQPPEGLLAFLDQWAHSAR